MYFIGIDIGTSSVKIIAINELGNIVKTISRTYPIYFPKVKWSEQDPEDWWQETFKGLEEIFKEIDPKKVKSISMSGQMHGLVILDKEDRVIRPAILWNDQRTEEECFYLNEEVGRDKLSKWTGNIALTGFTAPKLLWLRKNEPENFNKIEKIMLPKDYIAYKLSGVFATDYSDASGSLYLDVKNKIWSRDMLDLLGIREDQLGKLYNSYDPIGNIKEDIRNKLNLEKDVKIVIGGGDQAVAAVGGGIVEKNQCSVSLGTSGVIFANTGDFLSDRENRLHSFCNSSGGYHIMGVTLAAAASLKWWVEDVNKAKDYDEILGGLSLSSMDKDIYFLPYLIGERTPHNDSSAKAGFIGMDLTTKKEDMTRAVLEGVGFSLRDSFEIMREMGMDISEITINGGGARNEAWCQIIADILNVTVKKVNSNDGPAYGAGILAAVGYGLFNTVEEACNEFIRETSRIHPKEENIRIYDKKYKKYKDLYPLLKDWFRKV